MCKTWVVDHQHGLSLFYRSLSEHRPWYKVLVHMTLGLQWLITKCLTCFQPLLQGAKKLSADSSLLISWWQQHSRLICSIKKEWIHLTWSPQANTLLTDCHYFKECYIYLIICYFLKREKNHEGRRLQAAVNVKYMVCFFYNLPHYRCRL